MGRQKTTEPWTGEERVSFKCSMDLARALDAAAGEEHRTVSGLCRRALMLYLTEGGHLDKRPSVDVEWTKAKEMVARAEEELRDHKS